MKVVLSVVPRNNRGACEFWGGPSTVYDAYVLSEKPGDDGKFAKLNLPGSLGYNSSRDVLIEKALAHLSRFGFEVEVKHREPVTVTA